MKGGVNVEERGEQRHCILRPHRSSPLSCHLTSSLPIRGRRATRRGTRREMPRPPVSLVAFIGVRERKQTIEKRTKEPNDKEVNAEQTSCSSKMLRKNTARTLLKLTDSLGIRKQAYNVSLSRTHEAYQGQRMDGRPLAEPCQICRWASLSEK